MDTIGLLCDYQLDGDTPRDESKSIVYDNWEAFVNAHATRLNEVPIVTWGYSTDEGALLLFCRGIESYWRVSILSVDARDPSRAIRSFISRCFIKPSIHHAPRFNIEALQTFSSLRAFVDGRIYQRNPFYPGAVVDCFKAHGQVYFVGLFRFYYQFDVVYVAINIRTDSELADFRDTVEKHFITANFNVSKMICTENKGDDDDDGIDFEPVEGNFANLFKNCDCVCCIRRQYLRFAAP